MTMRTRSLSFSPVVYEHAAKLIGRRPWDVSRSPDLLIEAHAEAYRIYRHSPVVAGIDIYNLEAEAYGGCVPEPPGDGIPAIRTPVFDSTGALGELRVDELVLRGRIPLFLEAARRLKQLLPGADIRLPISGPFSIAANLVGIETLVTDVLADPDGVRESLRHLARGQALFAQSCAGAGIGTTLFESAAAPPLLSPEMFRKVELPVLRSLIRITGAPCIMGGDTAPLAMDLVSTGTSFLICPGETDQEAFLAAMESHPAVMVRVNMRPEIIAAGVHEEILKETDRVCRLASRRDNACVGTGVLPYETDPEIVRMIAARVEAAVSAPGKEHDGNQKSD